MRSRLSFLMLLALIVFGISAFAYASEADKPLTPEEKEFLAVLEPVLKAATVGPKRVSLLDQASITVPQGYLYIPPKETADFMHYLGNGSLNKGIAGMIISSDLSFDSFILINYRDIGHIYDSKASRLKADLLLKIIKEKAEESNKERVRHNVDALEIRGWEDTPTYSAAAHRLEFTILTKEGSIDEANFVDIYLGRKGIVTFKMITPYSTLNINKAVAKQIIDTFNYNEGNRYEDFRVNTDKVANYGLAALVTGIIAKKTGLLAGFGAILIKFWKVVFVTPILPFLLWWDKIKKILGIGGSSKNQAK